MYLSPIIMTPFLKKKEVKQEWYIINTKCRCGQISFMSLKILRGKNKPSFNQHIDNGDFVMSKY